MKKSARVLTLTGLLSFVAAAPVMAAWLPVILVPLGPSAKIDIVDASQQLPGLVEALSFRANDTAVMCRDVTAYYRSGNQYRLWRGMLPAGRTRIIHMLPVHRDVARIGFHCWALDKPGAPEIAADSPGTVIVPERPAIAEMQGANALP